MRCPNTTNSPVSLLHLLCHSAPHRLATVDSVNVDLKPTLRTRDKLKRKVKKVFGAKRSNGPGTSQDNSVALDFRVKIDDASVEQSVPWPGADLANWNECVPL